MRRFESFFPCQISFAYGLLFQTAGTLMREANQPDFMVFTGNANPGMAAEIAQHLGTQLGRSRRGSLLRR